MVDTTISVNFEENISPDTVLEQGYNLVLMHTTMIG